jgi:hypothetical protein
METVDKLCYMFKDDAERRGVRVPRDMVTIMNRDDTVVEERRFVYTNGTSIVIKAGVPPGGSEEFVKDQEESTERSLMQERSQVHGVSGFSVTIEESP